MDLTPKLSAAKGVTLILFRIHFNLPQYPRKPWHKHNHTLVQLAKITIESKNVALNQYIMLLSNDIRK
jgi:hypothetical protein